MMSSSFTKTSKTKLTWKRRSKRPTNRRNQIEKEELSSRAQERSMLRPKPRRPTTTVQLPEEESSVVQKGVPKETKKKPEKAVEKPSPKVEAAIQDFMDHHLNAETVRKECEQFYQLMDNYEAKHEKCCEKTSRERSRYPGEVPCYDSTRVILRSEDGSEGGFLHASKCKFDQVCQQYILTQAPMQSTAEDFWKMIFQEQSTKIVMLCNFFEEGHQSSEPFWPQNGGEFKYYGTMFVNNKKKDRKDNFTVHTVEVLPDGCSNSLITIIYHYELMWKSKEPALAEQLLEFRRLMKARESGPTTVISSKGIERAAVFTALDVVLNRLFKGIKTRVTEVVTELRKQRAQAIPLVLHYYDVHLIVLLYLRVKFKKFKNAVQKFSEDIMTEQNREKSSQQKEENGSEKKPPAEKEDKEQSSDG